MIQITNKETFPSYLNMENGSRIEVGKIYSSKKGHSFKVIELTLYEIIFIMCGDDLPNKITMELDDFEDNFLSVQI